VLRLRSARTKPRAVRLERFATGVFQALVATSLTACSPEAPPVTIDGSSPQRFAATAAAAREQLAPADRLAFDQALGSVSSRRHAASDVDELRRTTFDGMTGAEIADDYRQRSETR
jgi:hypothetical protein